MKTMSLTKRACFSRIEYRHFSPKLLIAAALLLLVAIEANAQQPLEVTAGAITHDKNSGITTAKGGVTFTYGDRVMSGDRASYDLDSGEGWIEGSVHYEDKKSSIYCDRAEVNSLTGLGDLYNGHGTVENAYVFSGDRIERVSEETYHLINGRVTSCKYDQPHWSFLADDIKITIEDYVEMKNASFRAGEATIFWLPWLWAPIGTKRESGFLFPEIGFSDRLGFEIKNAYYWAIAQNMDATFMHRYLSTAGFELGGEFRYIFTPDTFGELYVDYLAETSDDGITSKELWKVRYDHHQGFGFGVNNVTHLDLRSDGEIDHEYSTDIVDRTRRYSDSYTTFTRSWGPRHLTLTARQRATLEGDDGQTLYSLPSLDFTNQRQRLIETVPVYALLNASFVSYRLDEGAADPDPFTVNRIDFQPGISVPLSLAPWLAMTADAGYRFAYYSQVADDNGAAIEGGERTIGYPTAGVTLSGPKYFRVFDTDNTIQPRIKHLITPSVYWLYSGGYDQEEQGDVGRIKVIDNADRFPALTRLGYQLTNELLTKQLTGPDSTRTIQTMRLSVSQYYDIEEAARTDIIDDEKRLFSAVLFDIDTRFFDWLMVNYRTTYNPYDETFTAAQAEIGFRIGERFHFALDRQYTFGGEKKDDIIWDTAYLELGITDHLTLDYSIIYDEVKGDIRDSVLRIRFTEDCYLIALNVSQRKVSVTDNSGIETVEDDLNFLLTISLRGVGDILGSERQPIVGRKL
jgi:LPS-assembly protein